ncbi:MAG TPA: hypothetical protein VMF65_13670 [Acidimicrobiales bacterium]|nr:hypothetical protein [Acidimicrobiales bacterium]
MVDKGLSRFIPSPVHEAHRPLLSCGWEMAALSYMVAVWLSFIGSLVLGFSISFHAGVSGLFLGSSLLFIGAPVTVVALTLVARLHGPNTDHLGRQLLDAALTLFFLLGALLIVIGIIGFFAAFTDSGIGTVVDDVLLHLADIAIGVLAVVWALGEIAALNHLPPLDETAPGSTVEEAEPVVAYPRPPATTPPVGAPPAPPPAPPTASLPTVPPPPAPPGPSNAH